MNPDHVLSAFERDLLESIQQMQSGQHAAVHPPAHIAARKRGHPAGSVALPRKISTTIRLDEDVMGAFKASGAGWQTRLNEILRDAMIQGRV